MTKNFFKVDTKKDDVIFNQDFYFIKKFILSEYETTKE